MTEVRLGINAVPVPGSHYSSAGDRDEGQAIVTLAAADEVSVANAGPST